MIRRSRRGARNAQTPLGNGKGAASSVGMTKQIIRTVEPTFRRKAAGANNAKVRPLQKQEARNAENGRMPALPGTDSRGAGGNVDMIHGGSGREAG